MKSRTEFFGGLSFWNTRGVWVFRGSEFSIRAEDPSFLGVWGLGNPRSEVFPFLVASRTLLGIRHAFLPRLVGEEEERVTSVAFRNTSFFLHAEIIVQSNWRDPVFVKTTEI